MGGRGAQLREQGGTNGLLLLDGGGEVEWAAEAVAAVLAKSEWVGPPHGIFERTTGRPSFHPWEQWMLAAIQFN